ncbi:MAG: GNAT family N-acetyltransferase [Chromatiaceae bacterium]|nr:GNAT family N-acetyltransferase [Chromatiaceae bacterium]
MTANQPPTHLPKIHKAQQVKGKTLVFRDANAEDAAFILSLRTDKKKSRYLSTTSSDLSAQQKWLQSYSQATDQAYFIIEYQSEPIGTVRLYDAIDNSFCWGSWILKDGRPSQAAMESALMVYAYAVDHLGFTAAHFDVRKGNERVWQFHERFGAKRTAETTLDYFYTLSLEAIQASRTCYAKFLPASVTVTN